MNAIAALRWAACLVLASVAKLAAIVLAPAVCWLAATPDRRHLRTPWQWMETLDWDMAGDLPWRADRLIGADPLSWLNRVRWLWRNGAQAVAYGLCGMPAGEAQRQAHGAWYRLTLTDRAFYWRADLPIGSRWLELRAGWKLNHAVRGRYKVMFSPGYAPSCRKHHGNNTPAAQAHARAAS